VPYDQYGPDDSAAKSERDNIGSDELEFRRRVARGFLTMHAAQWQALIATREVMEVEDD
jgi:hypothetical protein